MAQLLAAELNPVELIVQQSWLISNSPIDSSPTLVQCSLLCDIPDSMQIAQLLHVVTQVVTMDLPY